ncbi:primase-helicase family protein [Pseudomonas aeruginosa]
MARTAQHPDSPGEVAIVLRGQRGTGKSFFAKTFGNLFGRHFMQVSDPKHLVGSFNAHLRDCVVLFGDEAFYAGDKKHEGVLKTIITEETLVVEGKGVDAEICPNFLHVLMASNSDWVVPAGEFERRFFVLDVGSDHRQDREYFRELKKSMDEGGSENLLHFLLTYDLSSYEVRAVPATKALEEQKAYSLAPFERELMECAHLGTFPQSVSEGGVARPIIHWKGDAPYFSTDAFMAHIRNKYHAHSMTAHAVGRAANKIGLQKAHANPRGYYLGSLQEFRDKLSKAVAGVEWDEDIDEWVGLERPTF